MRDALHIAFARGRTAMQEVCSDYAGEVSETFVIVERESGRVGSVVDELSPSQYLVRWSDGENESVKLGSRATKAVLGSARFLQFVDQRRLVGLFEERPARVFLLALNEVSPAKRSGVELCAVVVSYGFDKDEVAKSWVKVRVEFESHPDVAKSKTTPARYQWTSETALVEDVEGIIDFANVPIETVDLTNPSEPESSVISTGEREHVTASKVDLVSWLSGADFDKRIPSEMVAEMASAPLASSRALEGVESRLAADAISRLSSVDSARLRVLLASGMKLQKIVRDDGYESWRTGDVAESLFLAAMDELGHVGNDDRSDSIERLLRLASHLMKSRVRDVPTIARVVIWAGESETKAGRVAFADFVDLLADAVRSPGTRREALGLVDLDALSAALQNLPFEMSKGRSGLIASLYSLHTDELHRPVWWVGLDLQALSRAGNGALNAPLRDSIIGTRFVTPIVEEAIRRASTRTSVAEILGLPSVALDQIEADRLAALWTRGAGTDQILRKVTAEITDEAKLLDALSRAELAEKERASTAAGSKNLEADLATVTATNADLRDQLRRAADESNNHSARLARQSQLDSIQVLAQLALLIEGEAGALTPFELNNRVRAYLSRQNVEVIDVPGAEVSYEPAIHDAPGARPDVGQLVNVVRSGYKWKTKDEEFILIKSRVIQTKLE